MDKSIEEKNKEKLYEIDVIQLALYYVLSTLPKTSNVQEDIDNCNLKNCIEILKIELEIKSMNETVFYFPQAEKHIVNNLSNQFRKMDIKEYKEIINDTLLRIGLYNSFFSYKTPLYYVSSEEGVKELAYEIFYFNEGIEELKEEAKDNMYAKYELGHRYYYAYMDKKAYEMIEQSANMGYKKAIYSRIYALYYGNGVEKNEKKAFQELNEFLKESTYPDAMTLMGKMYYYGKGTQKDYEKAFKCFKESNLVDSEANYYKGMMLLYGEGTSKKINLGIEYLKKSGEERAINLVAEYLKNEIAKESKDVLKEKPSKERTEEIESLIDNIVFYD